MRVLEVLHIKMKVLPEVEKLYLTDPTFHHIVSYLSDISKDKPEIETRVCAEFLIQLCQQLKESIEMFIPESRFMPEPIFTKGHLSLVVDNKNNPN